MEFTCPYEILGLLQKRNPTEKQVKAAWRILSEQYHPDTGGITADSEKFDQVQWAYKFLTNAHKRKDYDRTGKIPKDNTESIEQSARENIIILLRNTLHDNPEFYKKYDTTDPFVLMRAKINEQIGLTNEKIVEFVRLSDKLAEIKERIIAPNDSEYCLIKDAVQKDIEETKENIKRKKIEIEVFSRMLEMLKDYAYRTEILFYKEVMQWTTIKTG